MTTIFDPSEPVAPTAADALFARESARRLATELTKANGTVQLRVGEADGSNEPVTIPTAISRRMTAGIRYCVTKRSPR